MKKIIVSTMTALLFAASYLSPINAAERVQIASMIDWSGVSLNKPETTISQSMTLTNVPKIEEAESHFTINIGNGENLLSPYFMLSNRNTATFGVFDLPEESTFETNNSNTDCKVSSPNLFSNYSRFQASCITNVPVISGETYTFSLTRKGQLSAISLLGKLRIESTGQIIDLGVINFNLSTEAINRSSALETFNQTSIYGTNLQCESKIDMGVVYSPVSLNGKALKSSKTRLGTAGPNCSGFLPVGAANGSYSIQTTKSGLCKA